MRHLDLTAKFLLGVGAVLALLLAALVGSVSAVVARNADMDEDAMLMQALDAGAEDVQTLDDAFEITTDPNEFSAVREKLEGAGLEFLSAEVQMIPQNTVTPAEENIEKIQNLLEMLEDNDDVQNVWHNAELPEEPEEE